MSTNELQVFNEYLNNLKEVEAQIKELQDEADAIKDLIKETMSAQGEEELQVGDFKVIYREVLSNRFDSTTFKKTYGKLYEAFTKQTSYKRLTIN